MTVDGKLRIIYLRLVRPNGRGELGRIGIGDAEVDGDAVVGRADGPDVETPVFLDSDRLRRSSSRPKYLEYEGMSQFLGKSSVISFIMTFP